jgi:Family of unknown function (DUF6335)
MAKRKGARQANSGRTTGTSKAGRSGKPATRRKAGTRRAGVSAGRTRAKSARRPVKKAKPTPVRRKAAPARRKTIAAAGRRAKTEVSPVKKRPNLDRDRRTLEETVPTPPSSLDMGKRGSSARSGRAALQASLNQHTGMTPELTGGDIDADWENAYFSGEEAPGGDNPTPDQDIVDDIGKALGVEYEDNEELKASDKVVERDKHRWELDPASSEDYKDRK